MSAFADQWTSDQQYCRAYGHRWRPHIVTTLTKHAGYDVIHACDSCTAQRTQTIDSRGYPIGSWKITYPEGYLLKGHGRLTRDDRAEVRLASVVGIARNTQVVMA